MTRVLVYTQNRELIGVLPVAQWSYERKLSEPGQIEVKCSKIETDSGQPLFAAIEQGLAYWLNIYEHDTLRAIGQIVKRRIDATSITFTGYSEEMVLQRVICPAQYGRVYDGFDLADVAADLCRDWHSLRVKARDGGLCPTSVLCRATTVQSRSGSKAKGSWASTGKTKRQVPCALTWVLN